MTAEGSGRKVRCVAVCVAVCCSELQCVLQVVTVLAKSSRNSQKSARCQIHYIKQL